MPSECSKIKSGCSGVRIDWLVQSLINCAESLSNYFSIPSFICNVKCSREGEQLKITSLRQVLFVTIDSI